MIPASQKNWFDLYHRKQFHPSQKIAGYYNHNYIIDSEGKNYILRIPIPNADSMDLRIIPESTVLKFLEQESFLAPRLIYENEDKSFFIHSYIKGKLFSDLYPAPNSFPDWVPVNIAKQMRILHKLNRDIFEPYCKKISKSPNSSGFFQYIIKIVENIYEKYKISYSNHFVKLKFPNDPFITVKIDSLRLKPRQFTLCHCDIHRKNLIISEENKNDLVILDWELVLVADPFYDIATHFHKMQYYHDQEIFFLEQYLSQNKETIFFKDSWNQIQIYLQLEKIKSTIVDIVRMSQEFKSAQSEEKRIFLAKNYREILKKAWIVWEYKLTELPSINEIYLILNF